MSTAAKLVRRPGLKAQPAAGLNRDRYRALWLRRRPAHGYARDGGVQEELGTAVGLTPPACGLLVRQGGAIAALEACRGTAQMHRGPHQLAARIAPPAKGTIALRRLAWAGTPFLGRETDRRRKRSRRGLNSGEADSKYFSEGVIRKSSERLGSDEPCAIVGDSAENPAWPNRKTQGN
jgi:hypothetical protein